MAGPKIPIYGGGGPRRTPKLSEEDLSTILDDLFRCRVRDVDIGPPKPLGSDEKDSARSMILAHLGDFRGRHKSSPVPAGEAFSRELKKVQTCAKKLRKALDHLAKYEVGRTFLDSPAPGGENRGYGAFWKSLKHLIDITSLGSLNRLRHLFGVNKPLSTKSKPYGKAAVFEAFEEVRTEALKFEQITRISHPKAFNYHVCVRVSRAVTEATHLVPNAVLGDIRRQLQVVQEIEGAHHSGRKGERDPYLFILVWELADIWEGFTGKAPTFLKKERSYETPQDVESEHIDDSPFADWVRFIWELACCDVTKARPSRDLILRVLRLRKQIRKRNPS